MNITEFINCFADVLDIEEHLSAETEFASLDEWNSMAIVQIIVMIDENYGISISPSNLKSCITLKDLFELLQSKL